MLEFAGDAELLYHNLGGVQIKCWRYKFIGNIELNFNGKEVSFWKVPNNIMDTFITRLEKQIKKRESHIKSMFDGISKYSDN